MFDDLMFIFSQTADQRIYQFIEWYNIQLRSKTKQKTWWAKLTSRISAVYPDLCGFPAERKCFFSRVLSLFVVFRPRKVSIRIENKFYYERQKPLWKLEMCTKRKVGCRIIHVEGLLSAQCNRMFQNNSSVLVGHFRWWPILGVQSGVTVLAPPLWDIC